MLIERFSCRTPHAIRARRAAGGTLAALAWGALLGACGSSGSSTSSKSSKTNLDTVRVGHSIEESILAQRHLKSTVKCPAVVAQEKGRTFECVATISNAKTKKVTTTPFVVTVQNSKGYVSYVGK